MAKKKTGKITYGWRMWNKIKKFYVEDGMTYADIASLGKEYPTSEAIRVRANKIDAISKLNWHDEKRQKIEAHYNSISPETQVTLIYGQISKLLSNPGFSTKDADALVKLQRALERITDWRYHGPMIFQVIERLMNFVSKNYPEMIKDKDGSFTNMMRHFKNNLVKELGEVNYSGIKPTHL